MSSGHGVHTPLSNVGKTALILSRFVYRAHSTEESFGCRSHSRRERCVCRVHLTSSEHAQHDNSAFVECSRQAERLSSALDKIAVRLSSALDKRAVRLSSALEKQCVCRVHSTRIVFAECTRQAMPLSSALGMQCVCRVHSTNSACVECTRQSYSGASQMAPIDMYLSSATYAKALTVSSAQTKILICALTQHPRIYSWGWLPENALEQL